MNPIAGLPSGEDAADAAYLPKRLTGRSWRRNGGGSISRGSAVQGKPGSMQTGGRGYEEEIV